jgi:hypothetical protein
VNRFYPRVSARALHVCEYCHAPEAVFNLPFEVEHIIPQSLGGESRLENLALSCRSCNLYKSDFTTAFDELTQTETQLFHPRQDLWQEHFAIETTNGQINGLTDIGRATVARLRINSTAQTEARRQWMRLGFTF